MSKIWGFGTSAIDIRITTADYGEAYKAKLLAQEARWMGGGSTSNFLVQVKRLEARAGWLGKLGKDQFGAAILDMLNEEKVDCSAVIQDDKAVSPFNLAVYAGEGKRRIGGFLLPNCMKDFSKSDLNHLISSIEKDDWVLIEVGEMPIDNCIEFAKGLKKVGAHIVIDVDLDPVKQCRATQPQMDSLFSLCDILMPNVDSMASLYPGFSAEQVCMAIKDQYDCRVVITMGSKGAGYIDDQHQFRIVETIDINVVDTVGAGDAFHGGVVVGLSVGLDIEKSMMLGNICGAHNCKTFGARDGMITAAQLEEYGFKDFKHKTTR